MRGAQLRQLKDAIVSAYPSRAALREFARFQLDRNLEEIAEPGDLGETAFRLVVVAESEGWLMKLAREVVEGSPNNELVRNFAEGTGLSASTAAGLAVPKGAQLFNDAYFDLTAVKEKVHEAMLTEQRGLLGLSLTTGEDALAKRLCAWLPHCLGELQPKDDISLGAVMAEPDHKVKQVLQHLPELEDVGVVCRVLVNDSTAVALEQFWQGVQSGCGPVDNWFVLVFVTDFSGLRADGVIDLGTAAFRPVDLHKWTVRAAVQLGWPRDIAVPWSQWIHQAAELSGGDLSVPLTYGALQRSARGVQKHPDNPHEFLMWLREKA